MWPVHVWLHWLQAVPIALAENSGLPPIESLTAVKKRQLEEQNPYLGIDCNDTGGLQAVWVAKRLHSSVRPLARVPHHM